MKKLLLVVSLGALSLVAQEALTNESIVRMAQSGLSQDVILGMIQMQPGRYTLGASDMVALKKAGVSEKVMLAMLGKSTAAPATVMAVPASANVVAPMPVASAPSPRPEPLLIQDGTPIRLRLTRNLSSADARTGDTIDFEVLDEVRVDDAVVIPRGAVALGTVTQAQAKRRMGRGGKLDVNIDSVRLATGDKAALRGVRENSGGGRTGAMTAGIVATSLVVWPAAPFFLMMHGKDTNIPKGTEITAYINGEIKLDRTRFKPIS